jgi:methyl-accepting chemotaxis protein
MTVTQRFYLLILTAVVGVASLAGLSVVQMDKVYVTTNQANVNTVPSLLTLEQASGAASRLRALVWRYISLTDLSKTSEMVKRMDLMHAEIVEGLNKYERECTDDDKDRALLAADRAALAAYDALIGKALALVDAGKADDANNLMWANEMVLNKLTDAFAEHRKYNVYLGNKLSADAATTMKNSNRLAIAISMLVVAGIAGMGWMLVRKIINALNQAVKIAQTVAAGDLTSRIEITSKDETGQLLQALKAMNDSLVNLVGQVRNGSDTVAAASSQIASGNLELSSRTEQQASSLEETAASMEEMTSTVKQNADHARQANQLAISASALAVQGSVGALQMIDTMGSINDSAKKVVDIIGVIDGIAFQTNILALNAAVEAARAGAQGKGFAVVATEVRSLAQRSAGAAKEIKALIGDSMEKVEAGAKLVDQADSSMQAIVEAIKSVTDIMGEITAASQEQTSGIEQINQAIARMDHVTQQNAALVEEAAAAAGSLQDQAGSLAQVVSVFTINPTHAAIVAPLQATRRPMALAAAGCASLAPSTRHAGRPTRTVKSLKQVANSPTDRCSDWEIF